MKYKFYSDSHIHSDNTSHAMDPIVKICEKAVNLNFYSISILDSCECDLSHERDYEKSLKQSFFEVKKAQSSFKNELNIFSGIELGDIDYSENDIYDILDMYFNEILEVIEFGHFDSLAHFNYPIKYITKCFGIKLKTEKICQKVRMVLDHLVKSNKALEISSSPDFSGDNSILSNENLLTEFKNLGGKYITIGSGAHKCSHMGKNLDNVFNLILNSGFDKFTIFKNRIPIMLPIISE